MSRWKRDDGPAPLSGAPLSVRGESRGTLPLKQTFDDGVFVVIGGSGFLGKVWWALLLHRFPEIRTLHLVVRSQRKGGKLTSSVDRFWNEIARGDALAPLKELYGANYEDFLREKTRVLDGDVTQPYCGISSPERDALRGGVDAVINASGVVDFEPPLDVALEVNAFGVQSLVALAQDLGNVPVMHTSTCFVAGYRTGIAEEQDPLAHPFPHAGKLERAHWDADREISECLDIIAQAKQRADDAFRQSHFLDQAKQNLLDAGEPVRGSVLENEIRRVRRKFVEAQLADLGVERARFWGWPNTYTYTKSIGEQIVARSGLRYTIVRPAIIESCVEFPVCGWNEGINTSAPLIYAIRENQLQVPGASIRLDVIPCDMVATGMVLALAELLRDEHKAVYQFGASDCNSMTMDRMYELSGLYKRKYYRRTGKGGPIGSYLAGHIEGALLPRPAYEKFGPRAVAKGARGLASWMTKAPDGFSALLEPTVRGLRDLSKTQEKVADILDQFTPFMAELDYEFRCDNTRAAFARLADDERDMLIWAPELIDWRKWFLEVHAPGLERWVFPELEKRLARRLKPLQRHDTLVSLLEEVSERYDLSVALQRVERDGLSRVSFRELRERAQACAARLAALGIGRGDRVVLAAKNHPEWPICFLGVLSAGATAVPLDGEVDLVSARAVFAASRAKVALLDPQASRRLEQLSGEAMFVSLSEAAAPMSESSEPFRAVSLHEDDVAALIYTSGTTGHPKGVMLTHKNLTSLVASLAPLFPLRHDDRVLSVLPLHHTFELTCGMLLPLSRGSRVVYLDELNAEKLEAALKAGRITAMVGVPALWEMLERKILTRVAERGVVAARVFETLVGLNRAAGKAAGLDFGRLLFGPVHRGLGGHLRFLVSGGASLNESTQSLFNGLGLHLTEGYGLTEAGPVLSVARGGPGATSGSVGPAIPDVEIRIADPDEAGVGEVVARGPNVMRGYADDEEATKQVIDAEGWLKTGDLGKLDHKGRLTVVGRATDTIVTSTGENVYPDDVEVRLGRLEYISELAVLGISDGRGGERVALACVVDHDGPRVEGHRLAQKAAEDAIQLLPVAMRPAFVALFDTQLPRTGTRKVKRKELRVLVEKAHALSQRPDTSPRVQRKPALGLVQQALAGVTRRDASRIESHLSLRGDLGCESLMLLEVLVALEAAVGQSLDAERFSSCQTVDDVARLLMSVTQRKGLATIETEDEPLDIPEPLRRAAMSVLSEAQEKFYDGVMRTRVSGRAFIPQNRHVLVVANHSSHLDMGLVKFALGDYAKGMVSLAAQDYFFEGKWRKAFFENFSNLQPISRTGSLRQLLRSAGALLDAGNVVLLFPEGTRSSDGALQEFKPALGYLALDRQVDILPLWLGGAFEALPKGATLPRRRDLHVRIGAPLTYQAMKAKTQGMTMSEASRTVAAYARQAVLELSRSNVLSIDAEPRANSPQVAIVATEPAAPSLEGLFESLTARFVPGATTSPLSYYFSLGDEKWTLRVNPIDCAAQRGKPAGSADCVLKTSPEIFRKIVSEAYTPSPAEFMSGAVKSNNIGLLMMFQKMFDLSAQSGAKPSSNQRQRP